MRKVDYHLHTTFSPDGKSTAEEHILAAIERGLDEICFTDHNDYTPSGEWLLEVEDYFKAFIPLKTKYKDQITVKIGIEIGLDIDSKEEIKELVARFPFDFVIGSIHSIHSVDVATIFHYGKSKEEYHRAYFEAMKTCVEQFDCFDVLGHLDYVRRYGVYEDRNIDYNIFQPMIDEIYKLLIQKGKGIEINCSGYRTFNESLPNNTQIQRFKELGGTYVTIGTDSHTSEFTGKNIERAMELCEQLGLKVATFNQQSKHF